MVPLQAWLETCPYGALETIREIRDSQRVVVDRHQHLLQTAIGVVALAAVRQVRRDSALVLRGQLAVVMKNEVVFGYMHCQFPRPGELRPAGPPIAVACGAHSPGFAPAKLLSSHSVGTNGSSATRIFFTARKIECLAAFVRASEMT